LILVRELTTTAEIARQLGVGPMAVRRAEIRPMMAQSAAQPSSGIQLLQARWGFASKSFSVQARDFEGSSKTIGVEPRGRLQLAAPPP